jgi:hypothetical protein
MDIFSLTIGIAVGAAFAPFWMMVWKGIKAKFTTVVPPKK